MCLKMLIHAQIPQVDAETFRPLPASRPNCLEDAQLNQQVLSFQKCPDFHFQEIVSSQVFNKALVTCIVL